MAVDVSALRIIPVLDLMHGLVVRGIAGRREDYQPLQSPLAATAQPLDVARGFRSHFQLDELYVADLDAIAGRPPAAAIFRALQTDGFKLMVDAGIRTPADANLLLDCGVSSIVVGLETVAGPDKLSEIVKSIGAARLVFSLDLKHGRPLAAAAAWTAAEPWQIAVDAIGLGVRRLLILDLARVGVGAGTGTDELCRRLHVNDPGLELLAGGGIRGREDIDRMSQCGVSAVLVASALHDGRLRAGDLL
jgi:phosphoribosylformimino-5-aminoimidazole carboxamide ribotide isomerase